MKWFAWIALFTAIHITVVAQPYQSMFGSDSTRWRTIVGPKITIGGELWDADYVYQKDTIISSVTYKKVVLNIPSYSLLFREDLDSGKVWKREINTCDTGEVLFMDYTLQKGDTFDNYRWLFFPQNDNNAIVDSVFVLNGRKHIWFKFFNSWALMEHLEWIEGVGCNFGLNIPPCNTPEYSEYYLLCTYKDGQQVFANKYYNGNCSPVGVEEIAKATFEIYPNPANNMLHIQFNAPVGNHQRVAIFNTIGQKLIEETLEQGVSSIMLYISSIPTGIYQVRILSPTGTLVRYFSKL